MKNLVLTDEKIMCASELYPQFKSIRQSKSKQLYKTVLWGKLRTFYVGKGILSPKRPKMLGFWLFAIYAITNQD